MQSLCTLTTSSDTFCTAVNEKREHNGASGWMWDSWQRGEDQRSEVEGSKEETNVGKRREGMKREGVKDKGRPKRFHSGKRKKNH